MRTFRLGVVNGLLVTFLLRCSRGTCRAPNAHACFWLWPLALYQVLYYSTVETPCNLYMTYVCTRYDRLRTLYQGLAAGFSIICTEYCRSESVKAHKSSYSVQKQLFIYSRLCLQDRFHLLCLPQAQQPLYKLVEYLPTIIQGNWSFNPHAPQPSFALSP